MRRRIRGETLRSHLTYANVVSTLCLFILLGGSAYAAKALERDSVRSKQIKNGEVKSVDLGRDAVRSSKVDDGSLRALDFARGQLPQGPPGPAGARGDTGAKGDTGAPGPAGVGGLEQVFTLGSSDSSSPKVQQVTCPAGKKVVGTGFNLAVDDPAVQPHLDVYSLSIINANTTVLVRATEDSVGTAGTWRVVAVALCANVSP